MRRLSHIGHRRPRMEFVKTITGCDGYGLPGGGSDPGGVPRPLTLMTAGGDICSTT